MIGACGDPLLRVVARVAGELLLSLKSGFVFLSAFCCEWLMLSMILCFHARCRSRCAIRCCYCAGSDSLNRMSSRGCLPLCP